MYGYALDSPEEHGAILNPMEAIDQGVATTSQVGDNVVAKSGVPYSSQSPPLVQQPSRRNTSFHSPMEGHVEDTTHSDFGPNALFWETPIGQAIALQSIIPTSSGSLVIRGILGSKMGLLRKIIK